MLLHGRDLEENTRESCESINSLVLRDGNYEDLALHILGTHIFLWLWRIRLRQRQGSFHGDALQRSWGTCY